MRTTDTKGRCSVDAHGTSGAPHLAEADHHGIGTVGPLDRLHAHPRPIDGDHPTLTLTGAQREGKIEVLGLGDDPGFPQVTFVGDQRVGEVMGALVRLGVGKARSAEEREPDGMPEDVVAIFGVVEQGNPVAGLTQIRPPVAAHLEARLVPARVGDGRPFEMAVLDLVGGTRGERTETGKATLRNRCRSCHSTSVWNSSRRVPADSRMVWVMVEAPKERTNRTPPRSGWRSTTSIESTATRSVTWSR